MNMMLTGEAAPPPARRGAVACVVAALAGLLLTACTPAAAAVTGQQPNGPAIAEPCDVPTIRPTSPTMPERLKVDPKAKILDPQGRPIILRGYNWGQWGTAQPQDAPDNVAQGANSVRIPLRWWGDWKDNVDSRQQDAPGHIEACHLRDLDRTIKWATDNHLWVTLFVDSNYGQGANERRDNFWTNAAMKQEFVEVWQFLANRYRHTPYMGAYEILPEPKPYGKDAVEVREFYESIIPVIREIDARIPVVVGPKDGYDLRYLHDAHTTVDSNVIYAGNYFIFSNPLSRIHFITEFEDEFGAPVWIDQVGVESGDDHSAENARTVLSAFRDNGIDWAWWTYRINSTNRNTHGIYYLDPFRPDGWGVKLLWLDLVGGFL